MYRLIALLALLSLTNAGDLPVSNGVWEYDDIINGTATTIKEFSYQVSLNWDSGHFCSGAFINNNTIITAAHCFTSRTKGPFYAIAGSTLSSGLGRRILIRAYRKHYAYNATSFENDIAVVKLLYPVKFTDKISFIELAEQAPLNGTLTNATGWDPICIFNCQVTNYMLQRVPVNVVSGEECASLKYKYGEDITNGTFCAQAVNEYSCLRDGGSPLVVDNKLVGVMSWVKNCAQPGYPVVYNEIASVREWILKTAKEL